MTRILFISLSLFFLVHCSSSKQTAEISQIDYEIYSIALDSLFNSGKPIVIRDSLILGYHRNNLVMPYLTTDSDKLQFPLEKNKLNLKSKVYIISYPELVRVMKSGDHPWDAFYDKFPESVGWVMLSTIHYKKESSEAIFIIELSCDMYCGASYEVNLRKEDDVWIVNEILQFGEA